MSWRSVYQDSFAGTNDIVQSIGGVSILLGLIAVLGLADASGWLVRLAGVVGIVGSVLFIIQVQRSSEHSMQIGLWFALAGSVLCVLGGLAGSERRSVIVEE